MLDPPNTTARRTGPSGIRPYAMLATISSAASLSAPVAAAARSCIATYSLGCEIIIAIWPVMNRSWFSTWVLVRAEVGTDWSRTYMS